MLPDREVSAFVATALLLRIPCEVVSRSPSRYHNYDNCYAKLCMHYIQSRYLLDRNHVSKAA